MSFFKAILIQKTINLDWILERLITLPSTHHAHHGIDEHSAPMGNYATVLIIWDVIFKTAYFPHRYPNEYGIFNDPKDKWYYQLWYYPITKQLKK